MAQWGSSSESGILRKNKPKENHEDLLVFGYACKLFRDDEKASYIDKGNHLIPWMGDEKLKIDRYDCRGALSDFIHYEASREGFDAMRWLGLNESERKLEQLCDKERYYSLHINEEEEQMYKEEEQKRQKTNEFQYSYDVPVNPAQEIGPVPAEVEEDEEYVPLPHLDVPVDIAIPKTVKENARIEKTALFVCKQGLQMEILIKAKQSDNPQFGFLNQGHDLYKYYRHVLAAIKNGRYEPVSTVAKEENTEDNKEPTNDDHYLHPSLVSLNSTTPTNRLENQSPSVPPIPYKPSANCAYSQLVNRIQGNQSEQDNSKPPEAFNQMTYEQQQYYQYYYTTQYYEYYKQLAQYQQGNGPNIQPPTLDIDPAIQTYIQQMAYAQYLQQNNATNPYAQIVSNVKEVTNSNVIEGRPPEDKPKDGNLLSLTAYGSPSDSESEDEIKEPSGDIQVVIDKMATYVSKNGVQFEEIVKAKGDPRFEFLNKNHEFYKYYKNKIENLKQPEKVVSPPSKTKEKKIIAPVCFSIKKPKEDVPKEIKSALPVEESDDDEENSTDNVPVAAPDVVKELEQSSEASTENNSIVKNGNVLDGDDPLLEMIDLTDDLVERKDAKRAEDKIKDKLAAAAREKMVSVARDRALQLERKKKAAAFLKLKSAEADDVKTDPVEEIKVIEPKTPPERKEIVEIRDSDDDDKRVEKKKTPKKKKSHKRKHSKSRSRKKASSSKKKRRRSDSCSTSSSKSS